MLARLRVKVRFNAASPCVWTRGLEELDLPVRHGEGKFVAASEEMLAKLESRNLVALRYAERKPRAAETIPPERCAEPR